MSENNNGGIERSEIQMTPFEAIQGLESPQQEENNLEEVIETEETAVEETQEIIQEEVEEIVETPEESQEQEEPEVEVEVKDNLAKYAAQELIKSGGLPEDFEISDDITEEEINQAYLSYKEEPLRNQIREEELKRLADEEGLTPEIIQEVKLKYYGVQDDQIKELQTLDYLSKYQFDQKSETFEDDAKAFLQSYYIIKGINPDRVGRFVETDLDDDNIDNILAEAQADLGKDYTKLDSDIKEATLKKQQDLKESREKATKQVKTLISKGEFGGNKYSESEMKTLNRALFDKTEIVEIEGKKYRTTLYHKMQLEAQNNVETNLALKAALILGNKKENTTSKDKASREIINGLNNFIGKKSSSGNTSKKSNKLQTGTSPIQRREISK